MLVSGVEELLRNISHYEKEKVEEIYQACAAIQALVINDARANHPYTDRTGHLTQSIMAGVVTVSDENVTAEVKAEKEYASFVEMGTSRSKPFPFLLPAVERNQASFFRAVQKAMRT